MKTEREAKLKKQVATLQKALQGLVNFINVTGIVPAPPLKRALDVLADLKRSPRKN